MFDTQVTVVGNLVADPRLYSTGDGQPVASFRIASTPRRFDRVSNEWRDGDTLYASVTCWRGLAENVATSLKKGQAAIVIGRLSVKPYETKDGEKRQSVDIDAVAVGPDLGRVVTVIKRAERGVAVVPAAAGEGGTAVSRPNDWTPIPSHVSLAGEPSGDDSGASTGDDAEPAGDIGTAGDESRAGDLVGAAGSGRLKARFGIG